MDLPDAGLDVEAVEKQLILRALQKFGGNQTRAAQFLNMSRRAFSYRLKKHGSKHEGAADVRTGGRIIRKNSHRSLES